MSEPTSLTLEQKATNYETMKHIQKVQSFLHLIVKELLDRAEKHDQSKLESPEVELMTEFTPKLAGCTFGSEEYEKHKAAMGPALKHHYARSRHHPEHYKNGINDMNLLDLVEMFVDWKAASERHDDGNLRTSIAINAKRFHMSVQLARIFENTVELLDP